MDRGQIDVSSYKHVDDVHVSCVCVTEPPPPVWPTVLVAVLGTLIIPAAAFGLFVCCASKRKKDREGACVCFIMCVCAFPQSRPKSGSSSHHLHLLLSHTFSHSVVFIFSVTIMNPVSMLNHSGKYLPNTAGLCGLLSSFSQLKMC